MVETDSAGFPRKRVMQRISIWMAAVRLMAASFRFFQHEENTRWKLIVSEEKEVLIPSSIISDFNIEKTEVTQADFEMMMGYNPSEGKNPLGPVTDVTFWDAILYCNARSVSEGLEPVYVYTGNPACQTCVSLPGFEENIDFAKTGYRLPVDGEWEKAYYFNTGYTYPEYLYFWGNTTDQLVIGKYAWYGRNSGSTPSVVAQLAPSPAGLFDIAGNVRELVWYTGSGITKTRVYGGCYDYPESYLTGRSFTEGLRSASANNAGFRIVRRASR